jgi:hypothetical protein
MCKLTDIWRYLNANYLEEKDKTAYKKQFYQNLLQYHQFFIDSTFFNNKNEILHQK